VAQGLRRCQILKNAIMMFSPHSHYHPGLLLLLLRSLFQVLRDATHVDQLAM
jgi:hypothetical protein